MTQTKPKPHEIWPGGIKCGPSALVAITGLDYKKEIRPVINKVRGTKLESQGVGGMSMKQMETVIRLLGYGFCKIEDFTNLGTYKRPIVKNAVSNLSKNEIYLLNVTGHFIVYHDGKVWDNWTRFGCQVDEHPFKGTRVKRIYIVGPATDDAEDA